MSRSPWQASSCVLQSTYPESQVVAAPQSYQCLVSPAQPTRGAGQPRVRVPAAEPTGAELSRTSVASPGAVTGQHQERPSRSHSDERPSRPHSDRVYRTPGTSFRDYLIYLQPILSSLNQPADEDQDRSAIPGLAWRQQLSSALVHFRQLFGIQVAHHLLTLPTELRNFVGAESIEKLLALQ